jgi:hypothetical protein
LEGKQIGRVVIKHGEWIWVMILKNIMRTKKLMKIANQMQK